MLLLHEPSREQIENTLLLQRDRPLTYREVGAADGRPPRGYVVDHSRVRLGEGQAVFERAAAGLRRWGQFPTGWMRLCWPETALEPGATVGILVAIFGVWSLNVCRVVYLIDEDGPVRRSGFAYGTLPEHIARGEERFVVEWRRDDDSVWYDIVAFSRPNTPLFWLGYPVARQFQKRFARASMRTVVAYTRESAKASEGPRSS